MCHSRNSEMIVGARLKPVLHGTAHLIAVRYEYGGSFSNSVFDELWKPQCYFSNERDNKFAGMTRPQLNLSITFL